MSNETEKDAEGRLPEATYWIAAGATASLILLFVWGAIVNGNDPNASWGSWGASFEPITGLLSSIAVAIAFVAMALQTHELRDQRKLMREQVEEAKLHRAEVATQRQATENLVTATDTASRVAALAAEVTAVRNVALAIQTCNEVDTDPDNALNHARQLFQIWAMEKGEPGRWEADYEKLVVAVATCDETEFNALFRDLISDMPNDNARQRAAKVQLRCAGVFDVHQAVKSAEAVLDRVRAFHPAPLPLSSKTNEIDAPK